MGSEVPAAAWVSKSHRQRLWAVSWGVLGRSGGGHCDPVEREEVTPRLPPHLALLKGPNHCWAAGCYGNHTGVMTPISKAQAGEGWGPKRRKVIRRPSEAELGGAKGL